MPKNGSTTILVLYHTRTTSYWKAAIQQTKDFQGDGNGSHAVA